VVDWLLPPPALAGRPAAAVLAHFLLAVVRWLPVALRQRFRRRLPRSPWTQRRNGQRVHGGCRWPAFGG